MSVLVAFSVTPLGVGEGVGEIVTEAIRVVRDSGLPNQTDAMFTVIEGDTWAEVMAVVQRAVEAVAARAPRVSAQIPPFAATPAGADGRRRPSAAQRRRAESRPRPCRKPPAPASGNRARRLSAG